MPDAHPNTITQLEELANSPSKARRREPGGLGACPQLLTQKNYSLATSISTLCKREIWRFMKVWNQTILAPVITTLLFLAVLTLALGGKARAVGGMPFDQFVAPGLIMMAVVQNAFANTSSSLMLSKIQGVIIDLLMPPFKGIDITLALVAGGLCAGCW